MPTWLLRKEANRLSLKSHSKECYLLHSFIGSSLLHSGSTTSCLKLCCKIYPALFLLNPGWVPSLCQCSQRATLAHSGIGKKPVSSNACSARLPHQNPQRIARATQSRQAPARR